MTLGFGAAATGPLLKYLLILLFVLSVFSLSSSRFLLARESHQSTCYLLQRLSH